MGNIRIAAPPCSLYYFGDITAVDMATERVLGRVAQGGAMDIPAEEAVDLGIAWSRTGTPTVKLRFAAYPGRAYRLYWLNQGFGAGMGVDEIA